MCKLHNSIEWTTEQLIQYMGESGSKLLENMQRGDNSNKKGNSYEETFMTFCVLRLLVGLKKQYPDANEFQLKSYMATIYVSNREQAYVDDFTIITDNCRCNYQLKNSYRTGRWNKELQSRFDYQNKMDSLKYGAKGVKTYSKLICSDKKTVESNQRDILNEKYPTEYFPYYSDCFSYIKTDETKIRWLLSHIVSQPEQYDTALRLLMSVVPHKVGLGESLLVIWEELIRCSKPNIFHLIPIVYPNWLEPTLSSLGFSLKDGKIQYRGFSRNVTNTLISVLE